MTTDGRPRRTDALALRQTISQLLEQIYAIEDSMEVFHRKGDRADLERAADNFDDMLRHVDRLGDRIAEARGKRCVPAELESTS
jgi:hypothetical protein